MNQNDPILIEVKSLTRRFGNFTAVDNVSLEVRAGEIFGFLGPNGAGKTTTIRMMSGILRPAAGQICLAGIDIARDPIGAKSITGYIPDRPYIYARLTGREFLYFISDIYSVEPSVIDERIDALLDEYDLNDWQDELVDSYSHGMKQRLATCAALVHKPRVLILDEPMVGLDPIGARLLKNSLRKLAAGGVAVFLSTHSLDVAEELADRLAVINQGKLVATGTLDEIHKLSGSVSSDIEEIFISLTKKNQEA